MVKDVELQIEHIVLFKSPREVLQINTLSQQLGLGSQFKEWYQDAKSVPSGHLLIGLTPKTVCSFRYCSNSGSVLTKTFLPAGKETKFSDDEYTIRLYSPNILNIFRKTSKTIRFQLSKKFDSVSERVFSNKRRASRPSERRRSKIRKKNSGLTQKRTLQERIILSSTERLQMISVIIPFVIE